MHQGCRPYSQSGNQSCTSTLIHATRHNIDDIRTRDDDQSQSRSQKKDNCRECRHEILLFIRCAGSSIPEVGLRFDNPKIVLSHASFSLPNCSISTHPSVPQIVPDIAMIIISSNLCLFVLSTRGSFNDEKWLPQSDASCCSI